MPNSLQSFTATRASVVPQIAKTPQVQRALKSTPTSLTAAEAVAAFSQNANMKPISIRDSGSQLQAQFDSLKQLARIGKISTINFTDSAKPIINLSASNMSGGASTTALLAKLTRATVQVSDTAANIKSNLSSIASNAARLTRVATTDNSRPTLTLTATEYKSSGALLSKLENASIGVQMQGARNQYITTPTTAGSIVVKDLNNRLNESQDFKGVHFIKFSDTTTIGTSGNKNVDSLIRQGTENWWSGSAANITASSTAVAPGAYALQQGGSKTSLTYSFMGDTPPAGATAADKNGWAAMNATQQQAVDDAFTYLSSIINVKFVKSNSNDGSADINFATNIQSASAGYANPPKASGAHNVFVMLAKNEPSNDVTKLPTTFEPGEYGWQTLIHEIGHALGLKHPGNYNAGGGGSSPPYLATVLDSNRNTVMSYKSPQDGKAVQRNGGAVSTKVINPSTYMPLDIAALQFLYGKNTAGNASQFQVTTFSSDWKGLQTIWAPTGTTLDASSTQRSNIIDLREGAFSSINVITDKKTYLASFGTQPQVAAYVNKNNTYFGLNNVGLSYGSQFNRIIGGSVNDSFFASSYDAAINGGDGTDTLFLSGKSADWNFSSLTNNTMTTSRDGSLGMTGGGDIVHKTTGTRLTVSNIEKIKFYDSRSRSALHTTVDLFA